MQHTTNDAAEEGCSYCGQLIYIHYGDNTTPISTEQQIAMYSVFGYLHKILVSQKFQKSLKRLTTGIPRQQFCSRYHFLLNHFPTISKLPLCNAILADLISFLLFCKLHYNTGRLCSFDDLVAIDDLVSELLPQFGYFLEHGIAIPPMLLEGNKIENFESYLNSELAPSTSQATIDASTLAFEVEQPCWENVEAESHVDHAIQRCTAVETETIEALQFAECTTAAVDSTYTATVVELCKASTVQHNLAPPNIEEENHDYESLMSPAFSSGHLENILAETTPYWHLPEPQNLLRHSVAVICHTFAYLRNWVLGVRYGDVHVGEPPPHKPLTFLPSH
jgi:hypothetical protein